MPPPPALWVGSLAVAGATNAAGATAPPAARPAPLLSRRGDPRDRRLKTPATNSVCRASAVRMHVCVDWLATSGEGRG